MQRSTTSGFCLERKLKSLHKSSTMSVYTEAVMLLQGAQLITHMHNEEKVCNKDTYYMCGISHLLEESDWLFM